MLDIYLKYLIQILDEFPNLTETISIFQTIRIY